MYIDEDTIRFYNAKYNYELLFRPQLNSHGLLFVEVVLAIH